MDVNEEERYSCTPVDSFTFASTGMDGIHYALLTDFGLVKALDEAPVIRISPMDSDRVQLVSRNLSDFFSLHFFDELLLLNEFSSEKAYLESICKEEEKDLHSRVVKEVQETFNLSAIPNAFQYIQELRLERKAKISISTEDSLAVLSLTPLGISRDQELLLASVRNLQYSFNSDEAMVQRYANELIKMGRVHEAESLIARLLIE
ncbi:hypothetical protein [Ammoniphilus sp. CFH 90114]|uniref:hypothetical protein n=1 Tax=Ammoniphilus sp. CFH 90114 TaxID=2493665 RepID=UPI00100E6C47|nr:hypothetical protein [Ammoniphilus sp. CFH 90114]RXT07011.1 hypothetical protein EIZ39_12695 [Ammoniphilus sp. CFH 90114]